MFKCPVKNRTTFQLEVSLTVEPVENAFIFPEAPGEMAF